MELSEEYPHSNHLIRYSPCANYLACVLKTKVFVRDVQSLKIKHLFTCIGEIGYISWSKDSRYLLCCIYKRATVQIWAIDQPDWTCKIEEGLVGLVAARWSPNSDYVLTVSEFQVRLTIWSITTKSAAYIKNPKHSNQALDFSHNKKYMAVAERKDCKDYIDIFSCENWTLIRQFQVATKDLVDLKWAPDDSSICVWDNCLEYSILQYSPDGRLLNSLRAYENALGIKSVTWCSPLNFLSIGSYDSKVRIINPSSWKIMSEFSHPTSLTNIVAYIEEGQDHRLQYAINQSSISLPSIKISQTLPNPKMGIGYARFNHDGTYLVTRNDSTPNVAWIWDMMQMELACIIVQKSAIKQTSWNPVDHRLALCCGGSTLYMWSPDGASCIQLPNGRKWVSRY
eukprot:TRINITY_DN4932_c0_g1_i3.p1 TRINITY_DN4932_c0_g1~~TRINITY_DN4932_c0_g1_i3.p1  ORF type:complete len:397 (+),score=64.11 TRINITY_DN4932_c0_g1_i3:154-1344(+)